MGGAPVYLMRQEVRGVVGVIVCRVRKSGGYRW